MRYGREIGERLKKLREEHHMLQRELCEKIGVSGKTLRDYEKGRQIIPLDIALAMGEVYGMTLSQLIGEEEDHA